MSPLSLILIARILYVVVMLHPAPPHAANRRRTGAATVLPCRALALAADHDSLRRRQHTCTVVTAAPPLQLALDPSCLLNTDHSVTVGMQERSVYISSLRSFISGSRSPARRGACADHPRTARGAWTHSAARWLLRRRARGSYRVSHTGSGEGEEAGGGIRVW